MPDDLNKDNFEASLQGTARLAQSALNAPTPPEEAEAESRRQVEQLMQEAALSPKVLREAAREQPHRPWWQKLWTKG
ncbi:MAG: hypothetical protein ACRYFS_01325 [Janthinobacterium lividum]